MSVLGLTDEEKKRIREKHELETKKVNERKELLKKGLQKPEEKKKPS